VPQCHSSALRRLLPYAKTTRRQAVAHREVMSSIQVWVPPNETAVKSTGSIETSNSTQAPAAGRYNHCQTTANRPSQDHVRVGDSYIRGTGGTVLLSPLLASHPASPGKKTKTMSPTPISERLGGLFVIAPLASGQPTGLCRCPNMRATAPPDIVRPHAVL